MDLSIIIVNWNTCKITCECLKSIYNSITNSSYEVIVIDNDSSDDSVETIMKEFPEVQLIESDTNGGFAWANNEGMKVAKGDFLLLLNSDTIVLDDVLDNSLAFIKERSDAGIVGCRVLNADKTLQPTCFMYPSAFNILLSLLYFNKIFSKSRFWGRELMTWWDREEEREVQTVTGCFMLVEKSKMNEIGGMDDSFFMYAEETDWCFRFEKAGYTNYFTPVGDIIHLGGASTSRVRPQMMLQLKSGILQFIRKNRSLIQYLLSCFLISLWFLIRAPYWFLMFVVKRRKDDLITAKTYLNGFFRSLFGYKTLRVKR